MNRPQKTRCVSISRRQRRLPGLLLLLLIGLGISVFISWTLAFFLDPLPDAIQSAEGVEHDRFWSVLVCDRIGGTWVASTRHRGADWSPHQATGQPDATGGRDDPAAWASLTQDGQREWLLLTYPKAVVPRLVRIYEIYHPGALDRITIFDETGQEHEIWRGRDPTPPSEQSGISEIPVSANVKTAQVKLHLDSPSVPSWNEIDAVALVDVDGQTLWAIDADASSTYARPSPGAPAYSAIWPILPAWGHLDRPLEPFRTGQTNHEQRTVEAFGWPMRALWTERDPSAAAPGSVFPSGGRFTSFPGGGFVSSRIMPAGASKPPPTLPLRPVWRGLAADSAFWALSAWLLYWALVKPRRFVREVGRMRRGCCIQCGYQLNYSFAGGCPECGWRRPGPR